MIKKIGQIAGYKEPGFNIFQDIESQEQCKIEKITRLGVQMPVNTCIYLNNKPVYIGSIERIEFQNVEIVSPIRIGHKEIEDSSKIYIILDYEYIEKKE